MPVCGTCDGQTFYQKEGKIYCKSCGEQSQEKQIEVRQEEEYTVGVIQNEILKARTVVQDETKLDMGKPWHVAEGMQCLLKAQVEALILMGFDGRLKEVVGELWFLFLAANKTAFCEEEVTLYENWQQHCGRHSRVGVIPPSVRKRKKRNATSDAEESDTGDVEPDEKESEEHEKDICEVKIENDGEEAHEGEEEREKTKKSGDDETHGKREVDETLTIEGDQNDQKGFKRQVQTPVSNEMEVDVTVTEVNDKETKSTPDDRKDDREDDETTREANHFHSRDEDINEENGQSNTKQHIVPKPDDDTNQILRANNKSKENHDDKSRGPKYTINKANDKIGQPQRSSFCLCFMGLVWLEEPILISDLIRWSRDGQLPYHKASKVFPFTMKFSFTDAKLFNTKKSPDIQSVFDWCSHTARKLNVNMCYKRDMFKIVTASICVDLDLPRTVSLLVCRLLEATNFQVDMKKEGQYAIDFYVGAFVTVAVKLVFYLDDFHEINDRYRDEFIHKLHLPPIDITWTEWVKITWKKYKKRLLNGIPREAKDLSHIHNLNTYINYCTSHVFNSFHQRETSLPYHRGIGQYEEAFHWRAKETYYKTFSELAAEMTKEDEEAVKNTRDSESLQHCEPREINGNQYKNLESTIRTSVSNDEGGTEEFTTETQTSYSTSGHNTTNKNLSEIGNNTRQQKEIYSTSFPNSISHIGESLRVNHPSTEPDHVASSKDEHDFSRNYNNLTEDYEYICYDLNTPDWHSSYEYFVQVISSRLGTTITMMHSCIQLVESMLFEQPCNL